MEEGGQRDCEYQTPEAPQPAKDQDCDNDRYRMDINHFREQKGGDDVPVECVENGIRDDDIECACTKAPLEEGHEYNRDEHDSCADVRYKHCNTDQQRDDHRIFQPDERKGEIRYSPDDEDLKDLAPEIVQELLVHLIPHFNCQTAFLGKQPADPLEDESLVLQKEEDEEGHQDEVYQDRNQPSHRRNRDLYDVSFSNVIELRTEERHELIDPLFGYDAGIFPGYEKKLAL